MKLKKNVVSQLRPNDVYGKAGDEVKLISENGKVAIVEGVNGKRFPVPLENLTTDDVPAEIKETIIPNAVPAKTNKKKKPDSPQQNTLF